MPLVDDAGILGDAQAPQGNAPASEPYTIIDDAGVFGSKDKPGLVQRVANTPIMKHVAKDAGPLGRGLLKVAKKIDEHPHLANAAFASLTIPAAVATGGLAAVPLAVGAEFGTLEAADKAGELASEASKKIAPNHPYIGAGVGLGASLLGYLGLKRALVKGAPEFAKFIGEKVGEGAAPETAKLASKAEEAAPEAFTLGEEAAVKPPIELGEENVVSAAKDAAEKTEKIKGPLEHVHDTAGATAKETEAGEEYNKEHPTVVALTNGLASMDAVPTNASPEALIKSAQEQLVKKGDTKGAAALEKVLPPKSASKPADTFSFFTDYKDAHTNAVKLARDVNADVGIRKVKEFGKSGFRINILPRADKRQGAELTSEVVHPSDPFMGAVPEGAKPAPAAGEEASKERLRSLLMQGAGQPGFPSDEIKALANKPDAELEKIAKDRLGQSPNSRYAAQKILETRGKSVEAFPLAAPKVAPETKAKLALANRIDENAATLRDQAEKIRAKDPNGANELLKKASQRAGEAASLRSRYKLDLAAPATMKAGEINKELDGLEAESSGINRALIDAGRGAERPTDRAKLNDPLSVRDRELSDRMFKLRTEIRNRYGSDISRLPKGYGPIGQSVRTQQRLQSAGSKLDHAARLGSQRGAVDPQFLNVITGGTTNLITQDVVPTAKNAASLLTGTRDLLKGALAPASVSKEAEGASSLLFRRNAQLEYHRLLISRALETSRRYMETLPDAEKFDFIDRIEKGQAQATPELQHVANYLRTMLDNQRANVQALGKGALQRFYQNYFPHIWKDATKAQGSIAYQQFFGPKGSLEGSKAFLKQRSLTEFADGIKAGLEPVTTNPVEMAMIKWYEMGKFIRGQRFFDDIKEEGWAKFVKDGQQPPPGWAKINDKIARVSNFDEKAGGFVHRGDYYAPASVSKIIDRFLSPSLRTSLGGELGLNDFSNPYEAFRAISNLENQMQLGLSAFHIATTTVNSGVSQVALGMQWAARGEFAKAAKAILKVPLVSDVLKGRKMFREAYGLDEYGPEIRNAVNEYIASGANLANSREFMTNWTDSFLKAWHQGNPWGAVLRAPMAGIEQLARPIFEYIVPRAKAGAFSDLAEEELSKLPKGAGRVDVLNALNRVQKTIDNRFGELQYDKLLWDNRAKDLSFILMRAPGWNIGTAREIGGGILDLKELAKGNLTPRTAYSLALPIVMGTAGALYQYARTGQWPELAKNADGSINKRQSIINYLAPKTGNMLANGQPERIFFPGYHKDVYGMATKPLETLEHKGNPVISEMLDLARNQDYFHRQIYDPDAPVMQQAKQVAEYVGKEAEPFTVQNYERRKEESLTGQSRGKFESAAGAMPASRDVTNTEAMNAMDEILKGRSPQGSLTQDQFARQQTMRELEDQIRAKKAPDIGAALRSGKINSDDLRKALRTGNQPYFASRYSELNLHDALKVYNISKQSNHPEETKAEFPILVKKVREAAAKIRTPQDAAQFKPILDQFRQIMLEQVAAAKKGS